MAHTIQQDTMEKVNFILINTFCNTLIEYFIVKADPLSEVKVGELGSWISRRKMGLYSTTRLISRALWRYRNKYILPKKQNGAFFYHMAFLLFASSYILIEHPERSNNFSILFFEYFSVNLNLFFLKIKPQIGNLSLKSN